MFRDLVQPREIEERRWTVRATRWRAAQIAAAEGILRPDVVGTPGLSKRVFLDGAACQLVLGFAPPLISFRSARSSTTPILFNRAKSCFVAQPAR